MSFRKRNIGVSSNSRGISSGNESPVLLAAAAKEKLQVSGVRPSAIDGRPTTSTGTATIDSLLLAGHAGLALDTSLLIEESGTTDYAGALLRLFAAEGLMQSHHVHVIGVPEQWGRELPGVVGAKDEDKKKSSAETSEKMKIAWRYERLGQFGQDSPARERGPISSSRQEFSSTPESTPSMFRHTFDLAKRLVHPPSAKIDFIMVDPNPSRSPFTAVISRLAGQIASSPNNTVHRIVIPSLLSPALYPPHCCDPQHILKFQHGLRALSAVYKGRIVIMQSLPISLYPRTSGLTRWIELLNDGVLELTPFPNTADAEFSALRDPTTKEEPPQGMLKVHKIPIFHDRSSGTVAADNDWTFTLSRRKFHVKPFNLPPIEGDTEAQDAAMSEGSDKKPVKADLEF